MWQVRQIMWHSTEGIKVRTWVQAPRVDIQFTAEEAIVTAINLIRKHLNKSDGAEA